MRAQRTGPARGRAQAPRAPAKVAVDPPPRRVLGNQAVLRRLQAKLAIGAVDDPLEHEADAVAAQVMRMPGPAPVDAGSEPRISRKCAGCEEEEKVRTKPSGPAVATGEAPAAVDEVLRSSGQPLDAGVRGFFEPRFGADFSGVRVHADERAGASARDVGARAYAVGKDMVFAPGAYAPGDAAGRQLIAHELTHVMQQDQGSDWAVRRDVPPTPDAGVPANGAAGKPPVANGCAENCLDPAFLALDAAARDAKLTADCPTGFTTTATTFFGQQIPAATGKMLRGKLLEAQTKAMRAMCLAGQDPNAYRLDRAIITYPAHSGGIDKSVDIDVQGQPYIAHESSSDPDKEAGERAIDKETGKVFERIAYWSNFRKSVITNGIGSVARVPKGGNSDRTWTDPATGAKNTPTTTGEIYDKLAQESAGMQGYFNLLLKTDKELATEIWAFNAVNTDGSVDLAKLKIPSDESDASVKGFRQQIANDYLTVGGSKAQLEAFAGKDIAKLAKAPPDHPGDRPFAGGAPQSTTGTPTAAENRRPELGFISLPKEVVVALTDVGLRWGAIDFGGASGDLMHFDCNNIPGC